MKNVLIIFAKEPVDGKVKTRLSPGLGDTGSRVLYEAFLKDIIIMSREFNAEERVLAYDCEGTEPEYLMQNAKGFIFYKQEGKDLGARMHNALEFVNKEGAARTVIIGSDSPTMPSAFVEEAFERLENFDVVIGPTQDGGYYLFASKWPINGIFSNVPWSSGRELDKTLDNADKLGIKYFLLDPWYDVDTPGDLEKLKADLEGNSDLKAEYTRKELSDS